MEEMNVMEIVNKMLSMSMDELSFNINEYGELFKQLAILTQGHGTLLWNENPADFLLEHEPSHPGYDMALDLVKKQSKWLDEVGLKTISKKWLEFA